MDDVFTLPEPSSAPVASLAQLSGRSVEGMFAVSDPGLAEFWGAGNDEYGGEFAGTSPAMSQSAFFSGVALISEAMGVMPLMVYKQRKGGGWDYIDDHPTNYCLQTTNNGWQVPISFKSMSQAHLLLAGNAVSTIQRNGRGQGVGLKPFVPTNTHLYIEGNGDPSYGLRDFPVANGNNVTYRLGASIPSAVWKHYDYSEVLHIKAFGTSPYSGDSVLYRARNTIGLTATVERFGQKFYNKGRPAGFLTKDANLSDGQRKKLREEWKELYENVKNAFNVGILSGGLSWQSMGYTNEDAQFLQTRAFQILEIARWLRIPPHMLGDISKATNSNIEQLMLNFIMYTLQPWVTRWEEEINLKMFTPREQAMGFKAVFDMDCWLRSDSLTRANVEEKDIRNGKRTVDEVRNKSMLNPYPNGIGSKPLIIASQLDTLEAVINGTSKLQGGGDTTEPEGNAPKPTKDDEPADTKKKDK